MKVLLIFVLLHFALFVMANNGEGNINTPQINTTDDQGRKQGKWIFLGKDQPKKGYPPENKISEGLYKDDRKNGQWITYFRDGVTPKVIGEFVNNRPNGRFQKFHPNGNLKEEGNFRGRKYIGSLKRYSVDGTLVYQANYNQSGQESGEVKYFYDNGKPEFIYNVENGSPTGKAIRYWNNGDVKEEIEYKNGVVLSTTGIIDPKKPFIEEDKSDSKKAPKIKSHEGSYKPNGYNIVYNKNKELWMKGEFKNDRLFNGYLYIYDKDGLLLRIEVYKKGVYHSDGQL